MQEFHINHQLNIVLEHSSLLESLNAYDCNSRELYQGFLPRLMEVM